MKKQLAQRFMIWGLAALILALGACTSVYAQSEDKKRDVLDNRNMVIAKIVAGLSDADKKTVDEFLTAHFERWNVEENEIYIPYYRADLQELLKKVVNRKGKGYADAVGMIFAKLQGLSKSEVFIVRYNALLMMGELDQSQEAGAVAVPLAAARKELIAALKDPKIEPASKIAILRGLVRHAGLEIKPEEKKELASFFDAYAFVEITAKTTDDILWMQELALKGIGNAGDPGAKGERIAKLYEIITTPTERDMETEYKIKTDEKKNKPDEKSVRLVSRARTAAALALASLKADAKAFAAAKVAPLDAVKAIAGLAADALTTECKRHYTLQKGRLSFNESRSGVARLGSQSGSEVQMDPQENIEQIRSLRQRTKAVAEPFYTALSPKKTNWDALLTSAVDKKFCRDTYKAIAKIYELYDRTGFIKPKKDDKKPKKDPGETTKPQQDVLPPKEITYNDLQEDLLGELRGLYELLGRDKTPLTPQTTSNARASRGVR